MNIPHKFLINNCISDQKLKFYEKLPNRYHKIITDYTKKKSNCENFHKKVINWLFNQDEKTKMMLCSVENKKYTNTIYEAYNYCIKYPEEVKFKMSDKDSSDKDKFILYSNNIPNYFKIFNKNKSPKKENIPKKENSSSVHNNFLNYLVFYQCETPITDYDNYSNYFTLNPKFLQNEKIFESECNEIARKKFLSYPIEINRDPKIKNNLIFELPKWIFDNNNKENKINQNYPYDTDENVSVVYNDYFTLAQYILSLIEQVLSVRYILYNENRDLSEIILSTYLYDLFEKKKIILSYLNSINIDSSMYYKYFEIADLNAKIFFSTDIEKFVENKKESIKKSDYTINSNEQNDSDSAFIGIEHLFEEIVEKNKNDKNEFDEELINMCMFIQIKQLFTLDDFFLRTIFENFYNRHLNQIYNELIDNEDEKEKEKHKKKKKKKKKNNSSNNEVNNNNIDYIDEKEQIFNFVKKLIFDNLDEKINKINEIKNNLIITTNKKQKKRKEFFLYEPFKKKEKEKEKKKINNTQNNNKNININNQIISLEKNNIINNISKNKEINEDNNNGNFFSIKDFAFTFISQNINITNEKLIKLNDDIDNFNKDMESLLILFRKIKKEIKNYFELIIKNIYKNNSELEIYGSSLFQLDIESSDLDLSISTESKLSLDSLIIYISNNNHNKQYLKIKYINTASIPIIKLEVDYMKLDNDKINYYYNALINNNYYNICIKNNYYKEFNIIKVDISLKSINYKQINFIKKGINDFPQIKPLIKILKKLLIFKNLNNSYKGGMSSYCLFLIIYSYLKINQNISKDNNNYGSLLMGFLYYYVNCIDFTYTEINPNLDNPFSISSFPIETIPTIIDPSTMKNAGKIIFRILDVVNAFNEINKDIIALINEDKNNGNNIIYKLFNKYIENQ